MATHEKNLDWVQLLRGVAALLVSLTHARYAMLNTPEMPLADRIFVPGAMGVDLFFIISGFIMFYSTTNFDGSADYVARFAIKRFARVWPIYAVITLLSVFVLSGGIDYFHYAANRRTFWHSVGMIPANPQYVPYFSLTLLPGWTLEFEMYFYLVFAASMLFKRLRWFVLASWVLLTVILIPLGERGFDMNISRDLGYQVGYMAIVTSPFVLEFAAGVLIGWLYRQHWTRFRSAYVAWHVAALGVAFALWASYSNAVHTHGPTQWGWPLALMVLALALASKTVHLRVHGVFLWLGSISYSLYLTHLLSQGLVTKALNASGHGQFTQTWSYIFLATAASLAFASLSQHYLEQGLSNKVRDGLLKLLPKRSTTAAAPAETAPIARRA